VRSCDTTQSGVKNGLWCEPWPIAPPGSSEAAELSPGDVEELRSLVTAFELEALRTILPGPQPPPPPQPPVDVNSGGTCPGPAGGCDGLGTCSTCQDYREDKKEGQRRHNKTNRDKKRRAAQGLPPLPVQSRQPTRMPQRFKGCTAHRCHRKANNLNVGKSRKLNPRAPRRVGERQILSASPSPSPSPSPPPSPLSPMGLDIRMDFEDHAMVDSILRGGLPDIDQFF